MKKVAICYFLTSPKKFLLVPTPIIEILGRFFFESSRVIFSNFLGDHMNIIAYTLSISSYLSENVKLG